MISLFGPVVTSGSVSASPFTIVATPSSESPHVRQNAVPGSNSFAHLGQYIVLLYESRRSNVSTRSGRGEKAKRPNRIQCTQPFVNTSACYANVRSSACAKNGISVFCFYCSLTDSKTVLVSHAIS